jgi:hypothetical protein
MKDANAIISQIKSIVMMVVGIVLVILLAGTVARAARIGIPIPALGAMEMAYVAVAYWAIK